ncbi:MAG: alpha-ketoglutarate-dependent dioxygenase AlkB [Labilithrix sp.]|nr:alpha-ketoglutarate-dependent dioxygenase AlkB [Labilithrix sp.]
MEPLADGAVVLRGLVGACEPALRSGLERVVEGAPFRHMLCPSGHRMSVAMSNCGALGWVSDLTGYRYDANDPESGRPWPAMPDAFLSLAADAAARAGFPAFGPDACLVNRYEPGARLSLHQDKDECDFRQPIVSVSLGLPATFLFGGVRRTDRPRRIALTHGDVVVWGPCPRWRARCTQKNAAAGWGGKPHRGAARPLCACRASAISARSRPTSSRSCRNEGSGEQLRNGRAAAPTGQRRPAAKTWQTWTFPASSLTTPTPKCVCSGRSRFIR